MIDKICTFLTNKIRKEMPEIDDERAEVINYGLQNIVGEIPKIFIMLAIACILGIFKSALFTFIVLLPYKGASGGVHLKTHIGCIILTTTFYCLIPFVA
ncbi:MAG: accessory gene regulator B family protein, partial [Clostridia bacterium]|nr:accessory gene regulator B family protein [Clostridia bacterium]